MTRAASLLGAVVAVLVAAPALAVEVAVAPFTGPNAAAVRTQVVNAACDQVECVAAPKKKAKKKPAVLNGKVAKNKKTVELSLVGRTGKLAWKKSYPLVKGKLSADSLEKATAQLIKSVGAKASAPAPAEPKPEPRPEPKPEPTPSTPPPETSSSATSSSSSTASSSSEPAKSEGSDDWSKSEKKPDEQDSVAARTSTSSSSSDSAGKLPTVFASLNLDLLSRGFSYDALTTGNLHEYRGFPIAAPRLHIDAYPLARLMDGWLTGLGLEADFAMTLGLKAVAGAVDFPSTIMRFNAALKFRIPLTSGGIAVFPAVGVNYASFSLSPSRTATTLDGLPEVAYLGLKLGAGVDAPLLDDKLRLGLGINYLPVFAAGEVISASYFPEGSVWGIGVNASAGYRVLDPLEVRLGFALERYALSFRLRDTDTYKASGASDLMWSLSLGAGVVW